VISKAEAMEQFQTRFIARVTSRISCSGLRRPSPTLAGDRFTVSYLTVGRMPSMTTVTIR
jgi:hypothetical protein